MIAADCKLARLDEHSEGTHFQVHSQHASLETAMIVIPSAANIDFRHSNPMFGSIPSSQRAVPPCAVRACTAWVRQKTHPTQVSTPNHHRVTHDSWHACP